MRETEHRYGHDEVPVPVELIDIMPDDECPVCGQERLDGSICAGCQEELMRYVKRDARAEDEA